MRVIGAYLLAVLGGNESPDASTITKILDSVGIKAESSDIDHVISQLQGKNLDELISEGSKKLSAAPSGAAPAAAAGGAAPAAAKEEKKEEKKKVCILCSLIITNTL